MRRIATAAVAALLVLGTTSCATTTNNSTEKPSAGASEAPVSKNTGPASPKGGRPGALQTLSKDDEHVKAAVADLAKRAGVPDSEVEVSERLKVTWPDSSLGCPQKGKKYTQATVPGERLLLRAKDKQYSYHAAEGKAYTYCETPGKAVPATRS